MANYFYSAKFSYGETSLRWNFLREIFLRQTFLKAKFPYGEISLRQNFHEAIFPYGEISKRRNFPKAKFPTAKIPTTKFPTVKFPSAKEKLVKSQKEKFTLICGACLCGCERPSSARCRWGYVAGGFFYGSSIGSDVFFSINSYKETDKSDD